MHKDKLVKYVRDSVGGKKRGNPIGVIVGLPEGRVGVSFCSTKDKFNKELGIVIAKGRAMEIANTKVPNREILVYNEDELFSVPLSSVFGPILLDFFAKLRKYYKISAVRCAQ